MSATDDDVAQAAAALKLMDSVDQSTHTARMNILTELAYAASLKQIMEGAMSINDWAQFKATLAAAQSSADAAKAALVEAATIKATAPPAQELADAKVLMQALADGLAAAVEQFTAVSKK